MVHSDINYIEKHTLTHSIVSSPFLFHQLYNTSQQDFAYHCFLMNSYRFRPTEHESGNDFPEISTFGMIYYDVSFSRTAGLARAICVNLI